MEEQGLKCGCEVNGATITKLCDVHRHERDAQKKPAPPQNFPCGCHSIGAVITPCAKHALRIAQ